MKTKRPKRVTIYDTEVTIIEIHPEYTCPSCYREFQGFGPALYVTRFICDCGQELIVDKRIRK